MGDLGHDDPLQLPTSLCGLAEPIVSVKGLLKFVNLLLLNHSLHSVNTTYVLTKEVFKIGNTLSATKYPLERVLDVSAEAGGGGGEEILKNQAKCT